MRRQRARWFDALTSTCAGIREPHDDRLHCRSRDGDRTGSRREVAAEAKRPGHRGCLRSSARNRSPEEDVHAQAVFASPFGWLRRAARRRHDPRRPDDPRAGRLRFIGQARLIQLIDAAGAPFDFVAAGDKRTYADLVTPAGLHEVATYADGIGVNKNLIIPRDATGKLLAPTRLIPDAHAEHLLVHAWTFRAENSFLPVDFQIGDPQNPLFAGLRGDFPAELKLFLGLGLDGAFSDQSDVVVGVRTGLPPCDRR